MVLKWSLVALYVVGAVVAQNGYSRDIPNNQLGYDYNSQAYTGNDDEVSGDEIPGEAGRDYPVYAEVPDTGFSCSDQQYPGYYADPEAQCQAFYICQRGGKGNSFLCPNGTVFNQEFLVCDWWYNFDCSRAQQLYSVNEVIVRAMEEADARLSQQQGGYNYNAPSGPSPVYGAPADFVQLLRNGNGRNGNGNGNGYKNGNGYSNGNGNGNGYSNGNGNGNGYSNGNGNGNGYSNGNGNGNGYSNGNGNGNGYSNGNGIKPVYGAPLINGNGNGYKNGNGNGYKNGNGNGYRNGNGNGNGYKNGNGNGYSNGNGYKNGNGNGYKNGNGNGYKNGNGNGNGNGYSRNGNGYSNGNGNGYSVSAPQRTYLPPVNGNGNGNGYQDLSAYRNGLGNGPSTPDRSYLPPGGNGNRSPSPQYGVPGFDFSSPNSYNPASAPDRSYLPPSK